MFTFLHSYTIFQILSWRKGHPGFWSYLDVVDTRRSSRFSPDKNKEYARNIISVMLLVEVLYLLKDLPLLLQARPEDRDLPM
jgi:hypothetical protein